MQYYFETIFPRVPKKVADDVCDALKARGLPTKALGNAGTGGPERRSAGDGSGRPASVKASLSVAFGQRAPNRPGVREEKVRERKHTDSPPHAAAKADAKVLRPPQDYGRDRPRHSRSPHRERRRSRSRDRGDRGRGARPHSDRRRSHSRDRHQRHGRDRFERDRYERRRSRSRSRDRRRRSTSRERGGRDVRDVFKQSGRRDVSDVFRDSASRDVHSVFRDSAPRAGAPTSLTYKY